MNEPNDFQRIQEQFRKCRKKSQVFWTEREKIQKWYEDKINIILKYYEETDKEIRPENITSYWQFPLSFTFDVVKVEQFMVEKGFDVTIIPCLDHFTVGFDVS